MNSAIYQVIQCSIQIHVEASYYVLDSENRLCFGTQSFMPHIAVTIIQPNEEHYKTTLHTYIHYRVFAMQYI